MLKILIAKNSKLSFVTHKKILFSTISNRLPIFHLLTILSNEYCFEQFVVPSLPLTGRGSQLFGIKFGYDCVNVSMRSLTSTLVFVIAVFVVIVNNLESM